MDEVSYDKFGFCHKMFKTNLCFGVFLNLIFLFLDLNLPPAPKHWLSGESPPQTSQYPWEDNWHEDKAYTFTYSPENSPSLHDRDLDDDDDDDTQSSHLEICQDEVNTDYMKEESNDSFKADSWGEEESERPPLQIYEEDDDFDDGKNRYDDSCDNESRRSGYLFGYFNGKTGNPSSSGVDDAVSNGSDDDCLNSQHRKAMLENRLCSSSNDFAFYRGCDSYSRNKKVNSSEIDGNSRTAKNSYYDVIRQDGGNNSGHGNYGNQVFYDANNLGCDKDKKRKHRSDKERRKLDRSKDRDRTREKEDRPPAKKVKIKISPPYEKNQDRTGGLKLTLKKQEGSGDYYRVREEQRYHVKQDERGEEIHCPSRSDEGEESAGDELQDPNRDIKEAKIILQDVLKDKHQDDGGNNKRSKKHSSSTHWVKKKKTDPKDLFTKQQKISMECLPVVSGAYDGGSWNGMEWYNTTASSTALNYNNHHLHNHHNSHNHHGSVRECDNLTQYKYPTLHGHSSNYPRNTHNY